MRNFGFAVVVSFASSAISTNFKFFGSSLSSCSAMRMHKVCRNTKYVCGAESVDRFPVPDDKVPWAVSFPSYNPPSFTMKHLDSKPWADPEIGMSSFHPKWNSIDGKVDRRSHTGVYDVVSGYPLNPVGRTGLRGRGRLGRWGPNHAADPIVTRWKRGPEGSVIVHPSSKACILQFVSIKRQDCGKWAIPGGMIDPGEIVTTTLRREFCEEAMNSLSLSDEEKIALESSVSDFFAQGRIVYKGYVDDPRNTDNAWMETVASNFHDESGDIVGRFPLTAGDDAAQVRWTDLDPELELYANHIDLLKEVAVLLNAHR